MRGQSVFHSIFFFIFGLKYCAKERTIHTLLNFLFGAVKLAIWLTRCNQIQGSGIVKLFAVLESRLKTRLMVQCA